MITTMTAPPPLASVEPAADLKDALRTSIALGEYEPGAKITEREIATKFGAGRTAVREALRYLAAEAILEINENRGARVKTISYSEALNLFQIREALEGLAGKLFTARATAEQKMAFAKSLDTLAEAMKAGDITQTLILGDVYYSHLLSGSQNPELQRMTEMLRVRVSQVRRVSLSLPEAADRTLNTLQNIVTAVMVGDPDQAREACCAHVRSSAELTLPLLASDEMARDGQ
jgi:DNA-binding GntR family transcriptional regulator